MSNAQGFAALRAHITRLHALGTLAQDAAPEVAEAARDEVIAQVRRQEGPGGKAWQATQSGKPALQNADQALSARAIKSTILMRLDGIYARHHFGNVRGRVRRGIIPTNRIPDPIARAVARVVERRFRRTMGGAVK